MENREYFLANHEDPVVRAFAEAEKKLEHELKALQRRFEENRTRKDHGSIKLRLSQFSTTYNWFTDLSENQRYEITLCLIKFGAQFLFFGKPPDFITFTKDVGRNKPMDSFIAVVKISSSQDNVTAQKDNT